MASKSKLLGMMLVCSGTMHATAVQQGGRTEQVAKQSQKRCPKCKALYRTDRYLCPTCAISVPKAKDTRVQDGRRTPVRIRYPAEYWRNRKIVLVDDPLCVYCGAEATTVDHVIAPRKGGTHEVENLVPSCQPCNSSKKDTPVAEWWQRENR